MKEQPTKSKKLLDAMATLPWVSLYGQIMEMSTPAWKMYGSTSHMRCVPEPLRSVTEKHCSGLIFELIFLANLRENITLNFLTKIFKLYRTITGQCNNLRNPLWGASITPHSRLLPSIPKLWRVETFMDGPSGSGKVNSVEALEEVDRFGIDGSKCSCSRKDCVSESPVKLPNVRLVSTKFFTDDGENINDNHFTHMLTQFGQFLDHDLTFTPEEEEEECCEDCESKTLPCERESCYPIFIPPNDPFYQSAELKARGVNQSCIDHSRSTGFCSEGFESRQHEQFNMITAFVDASNVYGSENNYSRILRTLDGTGKLRTENNTFLLPRIKIKTEASRRAGDTRALEMPGLASVHTVFVREHNQLCDALKTHPDVDSTWGDEDFYQNARRILIAEMQKIVYDEYLPIIIGRKGMRRWGLNVRSKSRYYRRVDPSQPNSFGTAAFRFAHTMIRGLIEQFKSIRDQTPNNKYELGQNYFNLTVYEASGGAGNDFLLNGLMRQQSAAFDRFVTPEVSNKLFASGTQPIVTKDEEPIPGVGADLMSRNLQRGRDHGLPSYAAFYKRLHKRGRAGVMDCWDKRPPEIKKDVWHLLRKIYNHPHHIDLFVGGLAESPFKGGVTGRTFQSIIGITFGRLKFGDRFFFTRKGYMNKAELDEIKRRSFGDIICDTSTFIKSTPKDVFRINSPAVQCDERKGLNIRAFRVAKADSEGFCTPR